MNSETAKVLAIVGAALLILGVFLPLADIPLRGSLNMADRGWPAWVMAGLGAAAALLALANLTRHAIWPGIGALALLGYAYALVNGEIARSRARLEEGLGDDPFGAVRALVVSETRLEYGWAVLAFGALLAIAAGVAAWWSARRA